MNEEQATIIHAKWIELEDGWLQCSNCGHGTDTMYDEFKEMDNGHILQIYRRPYYCGYCGAKMDKDGEKQ